MSLEKDKANRIWSAVFIGLALLISASAFIIIFISGSSSADQLRVGCVFSGSITETGWTKNNYDGVLAACKNNGALLLIKENVPEEFEACKTAVDQLVNDGCKIIFLTSYGYATDSDKIISQYPNIAFFANGSYIHGNNLTYYFGRMYQGRYLSGIVAGARTESKVIGYIAAMPNSEVIRGINAFTLGVRSVSPEAEVRVRYTGSWDDRQAEEEALSKLMEEGADVITYHQNQEYIPAAADSAGIDFIGYHTLSGEYSEHLLTCVQCRWELIYDKIIRDYIRSIVDFGDEYWLGISEGAITLAPFSPLVPQSAVDRINELFDKIDFEKPVFSGDIYDNEGNLRCIADERMSDDAIMRGIDWYAEGVTVDE